jgi:acyl dehydratase
VSLNHELVGVPGEPAERGWSEADVMLYALAVGAGQDRSLQELDLTTENSTGLRLKVLPTFANLLAPITGTQRSPLGEFDPSQVLHGEQAFVLHRPIPVNGTARSVGTITGIYDKGSGALLVSESICTDAATGEIIATTRSSLFVRGEGGFGGDPGPSARWKYPDRKPDREVIMVTRHDQALLYRLTGDHNPLHSDPVFAARGGFGQPILHGMCTYGYTGRALLHAVCGSDPARFTSMEGRFSKPVTPGDELSVQIWIDSGSAYFRTLGNKTDTVIDRGRMTFTP